MEKELTYAALAGGVERGSPSLGSVTVSKVDIIQLKSGGVVIHERIIDGEDENLTSFFKLGVVDIARNVGARASRAYSVSRTLHGMGDNRSDVLKAAGVPMITPLPLISLARLTLFPGEFSTRTSRSGMESPFWTKAGAVLWKRAR